MKRPAYSTNAVLHHTEGGACKVAVFALRIAMKYGNRKPTVAALMSDFGMSRATAFRWRAAWQYVQGVA